MRQSHPNPGNIALATQVGLDRWFTLDVPAGDMEQLSARYRNNPNIEAATPDYRAFPAVVPNDPLYSSQWGHNNTGQMLDYCWSCGGHPAGTPVGTLGFDTNAESAWSASTGYGSAGVVVAILDSGVDAGHPDLNQMAGYDYGDNDSNPDDDSASPGHGTACAGVAAGISDNGVGVSGIAGGSTIMPLKVANSAGSLFFSSIQDALVHAADNGADIASMSFSADITSDPATDAALLYAYNAGVTLLAASSNSNESHVRYPANNVNVIAVGAASPCGDRKRSSSNTGELNPGVQPDPNGYTCDGERWWGSNYGVTTQDAGNAIDIIAPTIMPTTDIQGAGGYDPSDYSMWFNGTSCSTPYAAGVCALIVAANPTFTPAQVRNQLRTTAIDVVSVESGAGWDRYSGYGMVDAAAAVGVGQLNPPVANFSGTPTSGEVSLAVQFTELSTNTPTSWDWTFGDGGTSTAQNPNYTYTVAGTYTVSLTATNADGSDIETKIDYIAVNAPPQPPVADFSGTPESGDASLAVQFTDLTTNNPTSWSWSFGDGGSSTAQNPHYSYVTPGTYTVSLTATNSAGSDVATKVDYITVTQPPSTVKRYALSDRPVAGSVSGIYVDTHASDNVRETITERESGGKPSNRYTYLEHGWDFNVASGVSVTFVVEASRADNADGDDFAFEYSTDGNNYSPVLTVASATEQVYSAAMPANLSGTVFVRVVDTDQTSGNRSADSIVIDEMYFETDTATPTNPPVADFTGTPVSGSAPLTVNFTDQSTNNPTSWNWDFGDGNGSTVPNPSHVYSAAGVYTVSLTATNAVGSDTATKVDYITVTQSQGTVMHVADIVVTRSVGGPFTRGVSSVTVHDQNGQPLANVSVTGFFTTDSASLSAATDAAGVAAFTSSKTRTPPASICFEVTAVSLAGATYDAGSNVWTRRCEDGSGFADTGFGLAGNRVDVTGQPRPSRVAPNPFLGATSIFFDVGERAPVRLEVYDVTGRRVGLLADEVYGAGAHEVRWDGRTQPAGIYFYRLTVGDRVETRKMILLRR